MHRNVFLTTFVALSTVSAIHLGERQSCDVDYTPCQPAGASASTIPATGPGLAPLYNDLLASIKGISKRSTNNHDASYSQGPVAILSRDSSSLCCNSNLACVNLQGFNVAMCYDHFTTNFKLANGASGTIDSGAFAGADGGTADLQNGSYTAPGGSKGNMYAGNAASESPSNTAAIPTPYTASGVGSATPLSALGGFATAATATTATAATVATTATVAGGTVAGGTVASGTVVSSATSTASSSSSSAAAVTLHGSVLQSSLWALVGTALNALLCL